jgi:Domain of unknown function (DUF4401)
MHISKPRTTWVELLRHLQDRGLLDAGAAARIADDLQNRHQSRSEPWFVQALLALGAWVAAIFFIICLAIADLIDDEPVSLFAWGAAFLIAATVLRNLTRHIFPVQLALALSVVGHVLVLAGAGALFDFDEFSAIAVAAVLLCIALYPLYRDSTHRFLSCLLASECLTVWIATEEVEELIHILILVKIVLIGVVFIYRTDLTALRPLGYALAVSVPANLFLVIVPEDVMNTPWWPANVVLAAALVWLYQWIAGGWRQLRQEPLAVAVIATLLLAAVTTPGVLAAVGLMVLGYARRDALLLGIGVAFFPVFIVVFYYELETTLLIKSWIMAASGSVLLAARWYLSRRDWAVEE